MCDWSYAASKESCFVVDCVLGYNVFVWGDCDFDVEVECGEWKDCGYIGVIDCVVVDFNVYPVCVCVGRTSGSAEVKDYF